MRRLTTDEFIERGKKIYGDKYDYSKVNYVDAHTKVCIICPIHGEFWKEASSHLKGQGCPKCSYKDVSLNMMSSTDEFVEKARKVHGDKYDYSKVEYKDNKTKVCIICPIHGEFWQQPNNHLNGRGCYKCSREKLSSSRRKTTDDFISDARKLHGDEYNYSKVVYRNNETKVCMICPIHGEFWQTPYHHLKGCGCPKCGKINGSLKQRKHTDEFVEKAKKIHGDKYDYSKVKYKTANEKVCIICLKHGEFWQEASSHLRGCGCPVCNESKLEKTTRDILQELNIKFIARCNKKDLNWIGKQHLDFYLPEYNIAIECQGIQHYKKDSFFGRGNNFNKIKERDKNKKLLCEKNNVKLIYIPYNLSYKQIKTKLENIYKK